MNSLSAILALHQGHPSDWSKSKKIAAAGVPWLPDHIYEILKDDDDPEVIKALEENPEFRCAMRNNINDI